MIDINLLKEFPNSVKENCRRRGINQVDIDTLSIRYKDYLGLLRSVEELRSQRNKLSKEGGHDEALRAQVKSLKKDLTDKESILQQWKTELDKDLAWLPNFLADDVPDGLSDQENMEIKVNGTPPDFDFPALDHQDLGVKLDIIDTARGSKVAQSGFYFWKGQGAQLALALFYWTQQELIKRGFILFITPCLAKEKTLFGTGYLPFFADQTYLLKTADLALIGTAEQTLVAYHADEVIDVGKLPLCYAAYSPCFRTEAGSYGKETRGIFRVHQFHKVEQIVFCQPEESPKYHQFCLENEEYILQQLGIPYRVVNVCVGDLGAPGYKKFDVEAWFPGYGGYREVCSNTNLTDFQSRRLNIRYKTSEQRKGFIHTVSATAVTDRVVCAILENFQDGDGVVHVPEVLRPFTGFDKLMPV